MLHRQLFVVEVAESGEMRLRQLTVFLDLLPAGERIPVNPPVIADRGEVERFLPEKGLEPCLRKARQERQRELTTIVRHVELSLNILIERQQQQLIDMVQRRE